MYLQLIERYKEFGRTSGYGDYVRKRKGMNQSSIKAEFANETKKRLRKLMKLMNITEYDLTFNAGGHAVSGEVVLHTDTFYVVVSIGLYEDVMYRKCRDRKDYQGYTNHWAKIDVLEDLPKFVELLEAL